jgi:hypothetical protein
MDLLLQVNYISGKEWKKPVKKKQRVDRPQSFWHDLCLKFTRSKFSSANFFLRSAESGTDVSLDDAQTFSRVLKKFKEGSLTNGERYRKETSPYDAIKARLLEYIELCEQLYLQAKCGLSWTLLQHKAEVFADELGYGETFKAGDSFIAGVLCHGKKESVPLHGEGMELTTEEQLNN